MLYIVIAPTSVVFICKKSAICFGNSVKFLCSQYVNNCVQPLIFDNENCMLPLASNRAYSSFSTINAAAVHTQLRMNIVVKCVYCSILLASFHTRQDKCFFSAFIGWFYTIFGV